MQKNISCSTLNALACYSLPHSLLTAFLLPIHCNSNLFSYYFFIYTHFLSHSNCFPTSFHLTPLLLLPYCNPFSLQSIPFSLPLLKFLPKLTTSHISFTSTLSSPTPLVSYLTVSSLFSSLQLQSLSFEIPSLSSPTQITPLVHCFSLPSL